jgi:glutathione S-transferase
MHRIDEKLTMDFQWFSHFHPERLPGPTQRYYDQIKRVFGVLDRALAGKQYLIGDKPTIADFSFIPWGKDYLPLETLFLKLFEKRSNSRWRNNRRMRSPIVSDCFQSLHDLPYVQC